MTGTLRTLLAGLLALVASGCAGLSALQRDQATHIVAQARDTAVDCEVPATACARPSPLRELGARAFAESAPGESRHYALLLDYGQDALLSRIDLIRGAQRSIDLQTYIFDEDDAGHLTLDELLAAARRGVRVRVLVDQLSALRHVDTLAALAAAHANFELRVYNPVLGRARISYPQYVLAAACCWRQLNRRMHNKLLLVDGMVGITGGRNYQDRYYDWDDEYNFRDRDVLVAGPVAGEMGANFEAFWHSRLSVPVAGLTDVARRLLREGVPELPHAPFEVPARVEAISRDADDPLLMRERLAEAALPVGDAAYVADPPDKDGGSYDRIAPSTVYLRALIESATEEVLLQTPYLVLSGPAQEMFEALNERPDGPRVVISTNSLAATDSFITYALAYKYKRRYLRDFGFNIYEYKPFPEDAPIDLDATGAVGVQWNPDGTVDIRARGDGRRGSAPTELHMHPSGSGDGSGPGRGARISRPSARVPLEREYSALRYAGIGVNRPVPLQRAGVRIGLHSKSLVIDERVGVVGTHNFDPRGDNLNTESALVIEDPGFAHALAASIRRDMAPANSWVIARRDKPPVFSGLEYSLAKMSEHLPLFDLWPTRYATSYEFRPGPGCPLPLPPDDPGFRACHEPVGDFPEVSLGLKSVLTRIFTAFGAGLAPIL
ncbi:phospholipase D family protein [Luteimonas sp. RD2P54]|uniref:Phospholipase D family protein n=1 Tax=Luteimonas endophytica TaxID=3042023 RepID=A0ABT6J8Y1_9GAMM|nr:phospholipase D family protein [Luteimonas endophytica]MDH5823274.1 phospholipase D family protein [Luteimonas endophytica]